MNGARQDVERHILEEAVECVESSGPLPPVLVLAGKDWHEGVVGIVAARLVERYHRPAILLGMREGVAKGSGRSIAKYDIMQGLNACADHLTIYGGHPQAVGLTLEADRVDEFRSAMERHAGTILGPDDLVPTFRSDAVLRGDDLSADTAVALAALGPFGSGNPRPRLLLVGAELQQAETTRDGSHLRCMVRLDGVKARGIGFGLGKTAAGLRADGSGKLVGAQFRVDSWQGSLRPEFLIEHLGSPLPAAEALPECGPCCPSWAAHRQDDRGAPSAGSGSSGPVSLRLPVARDLRGRPGRTSALAQVLATAEPAILVGCCLPQMLPDARAHIPFADLASRGLACVARGCVAGEGGSISSGLETFADRAGVVLTEWDVLVRATAMTTGRTHLVAVDPPYRREHVELVNDLAEKGVNVHLYYGHDERQATVRLLRYLVHPRFAMVCAYRALEVIRAEGGETCEAAVIARAAALAWDEGRVILEPARLARALEILGRLSSDQLPAGEAKLEARDVPAYAEAEAEYEECSRLCLSL